ncbi:IMPACT family member in pol 5'region [Picochlorum sp. SENEW3]|nr:IMPACT family member in pol 5'region [Picochlorum sp. SENEW3]
MRQQAVRGVVRVNHSCHSVGFRRPYDAVFSYRSRFYQVMASGKSHQHSAEISRTYTLPQEEFYVNEIEVKKSKFVATAWHVGSAEEAMALIDRSRDVSASHNCFAYRIGGDCRASDDGEPSNTAGSPILRVIEGMNLDNVAVMVTRYFGGTKLGTGGLVRAYSSAARELLQQTPFVECKHVVEVTVKVPVDAIGIAFSVLDSLGAVKKNEIFDESGGNTFNITFAVDAEKENDALQQLKNGSRGRIVLVSE